MMTRRFEGVEISNEVLEKFYDYVARNRIPSGKGIDHYLWRSIPRPVVPEGRHAICWFFHCPNTDGVWIREAVCTNNFSICFIGYGETVLEIISHRGLRQLCKIWKNFAASKVYGQSERERLKKIFKYKWSTKINGGLLSGEHQPRALKMSKERLMKKPYEIVKSFP